MIQQDFVARETLVLCAIATNDHEPSNLLNRLPFAGRLGKIRAIKVE